MLKPTVMTPSLSDKRTTIRTPIQNLERQIARLEERNPDSLLLTDLRKQLAAWKADQGTSQEQYFSHRPMVEPKPAA